ncbi:uncharacterized protein LOC128736556 [Sabethes cyaneus]|uniref:uncharacterized protein LOC128736556 n=1 Tax=Sabethes cyaneus TaxID=53552 RepID=UPI00237E9A35|nr:uncharacterized protein LOC128736556 [Sabethes cyaneus]
MSTSRYLNWSRPSPGRHPLRKQMSCFESFSGGRSLSVNNLTSSANKSVDFATFVTAAIIHTNRFQNYPAYQQQNLSRRGSASIEIVEDNESSPSGKVNRRPASAHTTTSSSSGSTRSGSSSAMARRVNEGRKVFAKQLSLDSPMLNGKGPAAGHAWTTDSTSSRASSLSGGGGGSTSPSSASKQPANQEQSSSGGSTTSGIKKRPSGVGAKNEQTDERNKKALLQDKDARINIKIFLGQTIQQDSSDNGVSDTECSVLQATDTNQQRPTPKPNQLPQPAHHQLSAGNQKTTEAENSHSEVVESKASKAAAAPSAGGRSSSLAQRRAQFHASRQQSEAHTDRRPPLVRAMSAPNRPIEENPKFLQNKKKPRKKKPLRERDEINECDEDDFDDAEAVKLNTANNKNSMLGPRSRSVIGGTACDIETLVSLLSSGGSDSEKEDSTPNDADCCNGGGAPVHPNIIGSALKSRAPMLKKTGKSVSFQESELKQSAGLNRDYYTAAHRKPPSLQPIANRIRRSQQLASSFNAFHLRDMKKSSSEESKPDDDKSGHPDDAEPGETNELESVSSKPQATANSKSTATAGGNQDGGDGQTPKERECYRLYQKMANMGLAVSYDTILRGMLTPTELRVLQKQRSKLQKQQESRQNSSEAENNESSSGGDANKSDPLPNLASSVRMTEELEVTSEPVVIATELQQIVGQ